MWTVNFQMFKLVLEKAEEPELKLPISARSSKKQKSSRKTSISAFLTMPKSLTVWITTNKASGGDGIPVKLSQILKDNSVKVLYSICQQIWKTQQWPQDWKKSVFIPVSKTSNAKECSNYCTIALISHAGKIMLKILQDRIQQYVNCELSDGQAGFRKGRGIRDQIANIRWIIKKSKRIPGKHIFVLYWLCQSLWLCGSQQTVENSLRGGNTRPPYLPPEKSICRSRSNN